MKISSHINKDNNFNQDIFVKGQNIKGIVSDIKKDTITVTVNNRTFNAKTDLDLKKGDHITAVAAEKKDGLWHLKIISKEISKNKNIRNETLLKNIGLIPSSENLLFLRKIIQNNLPVSKELFNELFNIADILEKNGIQKKYIADMSLFIYKSDLNILNNDIIDALRWIFSNKTDRYTEEFMKKYSVLLGNKNSGELLKKFALQLGLDLEKKIAEKNTLPADTIRSTLKNNSENINIIKNIFSQQIANSHSNIFYSEIPVEYNGEKNIVKLKIKKRKDPVNVKKDLYSVSILLELSALGSVGIQYIQENSHNSCCWFVENEDIKRSIIENKDILFSYLQEASIENCDIQVKVVNKNSNILWDDDVNDQNSINSIDIKI